MPFGEGAVTGEVREFVHGKKGKKPVPVQARVKMDIDATRE